MPESKTKNNPDKEILIKEDTGLLSNTSSEIEKKEDFDFFINILKQNFEKNPNELIMIVGKIGSGKSRLLLYLLKESINSRLNDVNSRKIAYYCENP